MIVRICGCLSTILMCSLAVWTQRCPAGDPLDFRAVADFFQIPKKITLGACSGVAVDSKDRVYLFHREKQPIVRFEANGQFVRSWGDDLIGIAHGMRIDRNEKLWVTDIGHHLVLKFSLTGKLLLALGTTDKPGTRNDQFNKPTDIAFDSKGNIYVSDGYGNNRVMKFSAEGKFLSKWGAAGKGPSQFNLPHTIVIDREDRIIVGDRENNRIQVFDTEGQLLAIWPGFAPFGLALNNEGTLFVADGRANQVLRIDGDGKVAQRWGQKGGQPGEFDLPHMLSSDSNGNLYVAEVAGKRLQKLARHK